LADDFGQGGITEVAPRVQYHGGKIIVGVGERGGGFRGLLIFSCLVHVALDHGAADILLVFFCQSREILYKTFFERNGER
jgi:hypothetical protein